MDFYVLDNENVKQNTTDILSHSSGGLDAFNEDVKQNIADSSLSCNITFVDLEAFERAFLASYEYNDPFIRKNFMSGFTLSTDTIPNPEKGEHWSR